MKRDSLLSVAQAIAARNLTENVRTITIAWDPSAGVLSLLYYTADPPTDDDREFCDIALSELIAEFVDIRRAENSCIVLPPVRATLSGVIVWSSN